MGKLVLQDQDKVSFECFKVKHETSLANLAIKEIDVQMSFCNYTINLVDTLFILDAIKIKVNIFATNLRIILPANCQVNICYKHKKSADVYSLRNEQAKLIANIEVSKRLSKVEIITSK